LRFKIISRFFQNKTCGQNVTCISSYYTVWTVQAEEKAEGCSTMCCQDGDAAIWQMLNEPAGWSTESEHSSSLRERPDTAELPTAAAALIIKLVAIRDGEVVAIQDGEAVSGRVPPEPAGWPAAAERSLPLQEQPDTAELPTAAAVLIIRLAAIQRH
jgi:hypothetical protein